MSAFLDRHMVFVAFGFLDLALWVHIVLPALARVVA